MYTSRDFGFIVNLILVVYVTARRVDAEFKAVSACFGTQVQECDFYSLECNANEMILPFSMKYGVKEGTCNKKKNRCLTANNGCCSYDANDCSEYWTPLHVYNVYRTCSGTSGCGPLQSPNNILTTCNNDVSTYIHIEYECVPDNKAVRFCGETSKTGTTVDILFNKDIDKFNRPTDCTCSVTTEGQEINVHLNDVRMTSQHTEGEGSACSSASLTSIPVTENILDQCDNSADESDNFVYNEVATVDYNYALLHLKDLYKNGNGDAPTNIWLSVSGSGNGNVTVSCFENIPTTPSSTIAPSVGTTDSPSNTTGIAGSQGDDGSNTGAIVAGVLVPIILLAICGGVVAYCIWKRKRQQPDKKHADPNAYTDNDKEIYDEIGFVPDATTNPSYNVGAVPKSDVKVSTINGSPNSTSITTNNGHTYQNVGNTKRESDASTTQISKGRLNVVREKATKLLSYFKKQTESDFPPSKQREREPSNVSYDHISRPMSSVSVEITPPTDGPMHVYSHTTADQTLQSPTATFDKSNLRNSPKCSPKIDKRSSTYDGLDAVDIGDSYIEFQKSSNDTEPNRLLPLKPNEGNNTRPEPPSRQPPSPSTVIANTGYQNVPNSLSPNSPNKLSPNSQTGMPTKDLYDYAESHVENGSRRASNASSSDVSEHSYKVLEPQAMYDYADVDNDAPPHNAPPPVPTEEPPVYEDVDEEENSRLASIKKHKSATDTQMETYYEEPVTGRHIRPQSSPADSVISQSLKSRSNQNLNELNNVLKDKKPLNKVNRTTGDDKAKANKNEHETVVKGDNTDTKDYAKAAAVKGVLGMAKLFEKKTGSDSDSSRQNSPRDGVQVKGHKVADRNSSDA